MTSIRTQKKSSLPLTNLLLNGGETKSQSKIIPQALTQIKDFTLYNQNLVHVWLSWQIHLFPSYETGILERLATLHMIETCF